MGLREAKSFLWQWRVWGTPVVVAVLLAASCGNTHEEPESGELTGVDEELGTQARALNECLSYHSLLVTTANLNLRTGPSTSRPVIVVIPQGSQVLTWTSLGCPTDGWYEVYYGGLAGWAHGNYLELVTESFTARDEAIVRAQGVVGFSYWWGHGAWRPGAEPGVCLGGGCPSCTHRGSYGADCSGFLTKAWVVPSTNDDVTVDSHPYRTIDLVTDTAEWWTIPRCDVTKADAFVYNINGSGHTFLYESEDGWGSMWAYECKGCSYGCVYNLRTAGSAYHAIRHFN